MSSSRKPKVAFFDTKPYDITYFQQASGGFDCDITFFEPRLTKETVKLAEGFDAICLFVHDKVDKEIAVALGELQIQLVALRSNGYNHIDVATLSELNIPTVHVPKYSPYAIAEYTIGLMLTLNRKIHLSYWRTKMNNFSLNGLIGFDMRNKTVGVIGAGQIGSIVVSILSAFQCNVLIFDPYLSEANAALLQQNPKVHIVSNSDELFRQSDIITLHCQLTLENKHYINRNRLAQMKPGAILINTSRGGLIDTEALIERLKQGYLGACALDVYEEEDRYFFEDFSATFIDDDLLARLLSFPNVLITSHQAFFTKEALQDIAQTTLHNIDSFFKTKILLNEVPEHAKKI